jgi:O-antigen/teichoic acid export membrane protein
MVRYLTYLLIPAGLWFAVLLVSGPSLVEWIYTGKWSPAVPALILFALATSLDVIVWVVSVSLNAVGLVKLAARRALIRTTAVILLSVPAVLLFGLIGIPAAYIVALLITLPVTFSGLDRGAFLRIMRPLAWLTIPVVGSVCVAWAASKTSLPTAAHAIFTVLIGTLVYLIVAWLVAPTWLKDSARSSWPALLQRHGNPGT